MEEPLVSIITPAFNAKDFIGQCIESVGAQAYKNWEHIIIDDCSSDNTVQIIKKHALTNPKIKLLTANKNSGPAVARQLGLQSAKGKYIAFLDSDDLWLPEKLKIQIGLMEKNNWALSYTQYRLVDQNGENPGRLVDIPKSVNYDQLLKHNVIACLTAIVNNDLAGPLYMVNEGYDDFILWLSVLKKGYIAQGIQQDLARYRNVSGSVSHNRFRAAGWVWNIYRNVEKLPVIDSLWNFANYTIRVYSKHLRF